MTPPDDIVDKAPDDGITRIAIPKPFRDWMSPLLFVVIVANMATAGYLRGLPLFESATDVKQILLGVACAVVTTFPFAVLYGLWLLRCRRLLRAVPDWGPEVSVEEAAERLFRRVGAAELRRRSLVYCKWLWARPADNETIVVHWHDEVPAVRPVRTPFEPRPLEAPDTLPVEPDASETANFPVLADASEQSLIAAPPGVDSNPRARRAIAFVGMIMIATSILWVIAQVAQALRQRWMTGMLFPLTITVLVGIAIWGVRGLLNRDRWFLVPGGIVLRRAKGMSSDTQVELFDRRKSIACIFELAESAWLLTLLSGDVVAQRSVTPDQLMHFLRTWMSPLTPPVARLVDFE